MTSVWYVGVADRRKAFGTEWSRLNGWSIPESNFSEEQLLDMMEDPWFLTGKPDGPRVISAPAGSSTRDDAFYKYYIQIMRGIEDNLVGYGLKLTGTVATYANLPSGAVDDELWLVRTTGKIYIRAGGAWPAEVDGITISGADGRGYISVSVSGDNLVFVTTDASVESVTVPALTDAATAVTTATAKAAEATTKASEASSSATSATNSAAAALGSADIATTKAGEASASATAAAGSAAESAQSAIEAANAVSSGVPDASATVKGAVKLVGDLGGTADLPTVPGKADKTIIVDAGTGLFGGGTLAEDMGFAVSYGVEAGTACEGNDTRLSDSRTPTAHDHPATGISDSTAVGRSVITAADASAARSAIGAGTSNIVVGTGAGDAKAGNYQPAAANISDSTATGRSVLTAADQATARSAIGAGTSSIVVGSGAGDAKPGNYQPTAANISDSTAIGRSVVTATDAAAARTAIGAGTSSLAVGTTTGTACEGNDSRVVNAVQPYTGQSFTIRQITQAAYDALGAGRPATTLYVIVG